MDSVLFDHVNQFVRREHISRSRLIADAVREYLERHENRSLLDALNKAYADDDTDAVHRMRNSHRALVEGEW